MFVNLETATIEELKANYHQIHEHLRQELEPEKAALGESLIDLQESLMEGENVSRKISEVRKSIETIDLTIAACNRRLQKLEGIIPARLKDSSRAALSQREEIFRTLQDEKKELLRRLLAHLAAAAVVAEQIEGKRLGLFGTHWSEMLPNLDFRRFHFDHMEIGATVKMAREKSPADNQRSIEIRTVDFHNETRRLQKIMDGSAAEVFAEYVGPLAGDQPEAEDAEPEQAAAVDEEPSEEGAADPARSSYTSHLQDSEGR